MCIYIYIYREREREMKENILAEIKVTITEKLPHK